jgi:hypothetical protein
MELLGVSHTYENIRRVEHTTMIVLERILRREGEVMEPSERTPMSEYGRILYCITLYSTVCLPNRKFRPVTSPTENVQRIAVHYVVAHCRGILCAVKTKGGVLLW